MEKLIKVKILRGVTLTDPHLWDRAKSAQPPVYAIGDIVEVTRLTAQSLIGMGKAEYYSGPAVIPPAAYEPQEEEPDVEEEGEVITAEAVPTETATHRLPRRRRG